MLADRDWAERPGALHVGVRYRGAPVQCAIRGGHDGRLDEQDAIVFQTQSINRHSPWSTYEIVRLESGADDAALCTLESSDHALPGPARRMLGYHVAEVSREPLPSQDAPLALDGALHRWQRADYLMVAPRDFMASLRPLIAHREAQGHVVAAVPAEDIFDRWSYGEPDPEAIQRAVTFFRHHTGGRLRYLLLATDVRSAYVYPGPGFTPVPTFYGRKVHYPGYTRDTEFPTDHPYAVPASHRARPYAAKPAADIAVGRLPARDKAELAGMVRKIVDYESRPRRGDWQRRLVLFGGPAKYSRLVDGIIENIATNLLNDKVSYDYDLRLLFAKADSPYAYRFDKLSDRLVSDLNDGALFATYFGHGQRDKLDMVYYKGSNHYIGTADDLQRVDIPRGQPFFLSFSCHTGAYDQADGDASLAEILALNPNGPVAVFASSRASHPYPNALYAQAFIERFLDKRPKTLGDGILELKEAMRQRRLLLAETLVGQDTAELKEEHLGLYNLLGDPAQRLSYPDALKVESHLMPDGGVKAVITSATGGSVRVTLETERLTIRGKLTSADQLDRMSTKRAFKSMEKNLETALDKVVETREVTLTGGRAEVVFGRLKAGGRYVVKALITGDKGLAAGHTALDAPARFTARR